MTKISVFFTFLILYFGLLVDHMHTQRSLYFSISNKHISMLINQKDTTLLIKDINDKKRNQNFLPFFFVTK